jgi:PAS domain S-box-containing protein
MIDRMNEGIVKSIFETMPMEITVIDDQDEVVGWNKHEKRIFKRPLSSMGLNFRECHPQESLSKVEKIVEEMKAGKRDSARFWINMAVTPGGKEHTLLIEFFALRDDQGKYIGCLECDQDIEDLMQLKGEKRLLD